MGLHFDRVAFHYGQGPHGLEGFDLEVESGELLAIIGASGSGKSTLLRLVAGLLRQQKGRIVLDGTDLSDVAVHRRNIGMVFQQYALFPHLDLLGNVAYGLKMKGVARQQAERRAQDMLEMVGLGTIMPRFPHQISGGQQQRVALARALAYSPGALLLDEPLSALDVSIRGHLRDQIKLMQREFHATTLMVTHDQEEALAIADRVAVMQQGRLLQVAKPQVLYQRPASRAVAGFVGHSTILEGRVAAPGSVDVGFARLAADTGGRVPGAQVGLLIRPEHVKSMASKATDNCLAGMLGMVRYLGAVMRYDFLPQGASGPILGEGAALPSQHIYIRPEDIYLLDA